MPNDPPVADPEGADRVIRQGRALVGAVEALGIIEPSAWSERAIAGLLLEAYKRRLRAILGVAPAWVGDRILGASESIQEARSALLGEN